MCLCVYDIPSTACRKPSRLDSIAVSVLSICSYFGWAWQTQNLRGAGLSNPDVQELLWRKPCLCHHHHPYKQASLSWSESFAFDQGLNQPSIIHILSRYSGNTAPSSLVALIRNNQQHIYSVYCEIFTSLLLHSHDAKIKINNRLWTLWMWKRAGRVNLWRVVCWQRAGLPSYSR